MAVHEDILYVGSQGSSDNHLVTIDVTTGQRIDHFPGTNDYVRAIAGADGRVYLGGEFTVSGGERRQNLAGFTTDTGELTPWAPEASGRVNVLSLGDNRLYLGGGFETIDDQDRESLAAFDLATGDLSDWAPSASHDYYSWTNVNAIEEAGNQVYLGGGFNQVNGETRQRLAAVSAQTGDLASWDPALELEDPSSNTSVDALQVSATHVYFGGQFTSSAEDGPINLGAAEANTGALAGWKPNPDGRVESLTLANNRLLVGGRFTGFDNTDDRSRLAAFTLPNRALDNARHDTWERNGISVMATTVVDGTLYIGDHGDGIGGYNEFLATELTTGDPLSWDKSVRSLAERSNAIHTLTADGDIIYVGGEFGSVEGEIRSGLTAFDLNTGELVY